MMDFTYENSVKYQQMLLDQLTKFVGEYTNILNTIQPSKWSEHMPNNPDPPKPSIPAGEGYEWILKDGVWVRHKIGDPLTQSVPTNPTNTTSNLSTASLSTLGGAAGAIRSLMNNNNMELMVTLSPDLEARIVSKSMQETANAIMRVRKART
jgi:hypothetical protein